MSYLLDLEFTFFINRSCEGDEMNIKAVNRALFLGASALLILLVSGSLGFVQEKTDEALTKKYAPILGDYEFDLADLGGDVQTLSVLIKEGELWIDSGDGDPAVMHPVEGIEFSFTAESSDGQTFEIKFAKDEEGQFNICQVNIVSMGIEIQGTKIK